MVKHTYTGTARGETAASETTRSETFPQQKCLTVKLSMTKLLVVKMTVAKLPRAHKLIINVDMGIEFQFPSLNGFRVISVY